MLDNLEEETWCNRRIQTGILRIVWKEHVNNVLRNLESIDLYFTALRVIYSGDIFRIVGGYLKYQMNENKKETAGISNEERRSEKFDTHMTLWKQEERTLKPGNLINEPVQTDEGTRNEGSKTVNIDKSYKR